MEKKLLAWILWELCTQSRLLLLCELDKRCLIPHDTVESSLLSMYESTADVVEIVTGLLEEAEKDDR